jgi:hypothetical protein
MSDNHQTEWVWRPGFGWVERPVVTVEVEDERDDEPAAAA